MEWNKFLDRRMQNSGWWTSCWAGVERNLPTIKMEFVKYWMSIWVWRKSAEGSHAFTCIREICLPIWNLNQWIDPTDFSLPLYLAGMDGMQCSPNGGILEFLDGSQIRPWPASRWPIAWITANAKKSPWSLVVRPSFLLQTLSLRRYYFDDWWMLKM